MSLFVLTSRAGFNLCRALFRKKCAAPYPRRQTLFFLEKNWRFFWSSLSLLFISLVHSSVAHYFRHVAMLQKNCRSSCEGPFFVGAPVRPNMLSSLNPPLLASQDLKADLVSTGEASSGELITLNVMYNRVSLSERDVVTCRAVSICLPLITDSQVFDVKALRAFRVLRPLKLVSGVPSERASAVLVLSLLTLNLTLDYIE